MDSRRAAYREPSEPARAAGRPAGRGDPRACARNSQASAGANKLELASSLADLATEGDFGRDTLQEVTVTLESPFASIRPTSPEMPHQQLVQWSVYEGMKSRHPAPVFAEVKKAPRGRRGGAGLAQFTLSDRDGKQWSLAGLRGKVVLLNFWATWCGPCRKEMPDLESVYQRFGPEGLVVLSITDDEPEKVKSYLAGRPYTSRCCSIPAGLRRKPSVSK